jgi:3-methyladenine DNA glycosylase AlkC
MIDPYKTLVRRKGATRGVDIPHSVLEGLNCGALSSVNLTEWLNVDNRKLLDCVFRELNQDGLVTSIHQALDQLKKPTVNAIQLTIGQALVEYAGSSVEQERIMRMLMHHPSDTVRCWAAYMIGSDESRTLTDRLGAIYQLADDSHFGVREVAWLAVRPAIAAELEASIGILTGWSYNKSENIRRFASESTRPRGVWCAHIDVLKTNPEKALPVLEPLKSDTSEYVRNSVGNWLNDASKTQPDWVKTTCKRWLKESPTTETAYICKRAQRSI